MDGDDHRDGRGRHGVSVEKRQEIESLKSLGDSLHAEFERLYKDYRNLGSKHEEAFRTGKKLEKRYSEMDGGTYRKQWRKLYEEEIVLQELGASVRQYAEDVRRRREEVWEARERLKKDIPPR